MNYSFEVAGIPQYEDAYLPRTVNKSSAIDKMQERFAYMNEPPVSTIRRENPPPRKVAPRSLCKVTTTSSACIKSPSILKKKSQPSILNIAKKSMTVEDPAATVSPKTEMEEKKQKQKQPKSGKTNPAMISFKKGKCMKKKFVPKKSVKSEEDETKPRGWEFGKKKRFVRHLPIPENDAAAVQIQRVARGGMQRLNYKIRRLQWLLNTRQKRTDSEVAKIQEKLQSDKDAFDREVEEKLAKSSLELNQKEEVVCESHQIIEYLRKQNRKLREKNEDIFEACRSLKVQNKRLEAANEATQGNLKILKTHFEQIQETHKKLTDVIPRYKKNIEMMQDELQMRDQYCLAEHIIKLKYTKLMGDVVDKVEGHCGQEELEENLLYSCLEMAGKEHDVPFPSHLEEQLHSSDSSISFSSSSSYDDDNVLGK